jgi:hypothetical protein
MASQTNLREMNVNYYIRNIEASRGEVARDCDDKREEKEPKYRGVRVIFISRERVPKSPRWLYDTKPFRV